MEKLKTINTTLTFFIKGNKVLLGEKKRGFAKGTLNGIGGKQDPGETIEQAMIRECQEEVGVTPKTYEQVGKIDFDLWYKTERANMEMFVYKCYEYDGEFLETEEIIPAWFDQDKIPFKKMLEDDLLWVPNVLSGKKVLGKVKLGEQNEMISHDFKFYESLCDQENQNAK